MGAAVTVPAAEVEKARAALREHVDDLTTIAHHKIETDEGDIRHATTPSLLSQLGAEVAGNSMNNGGVAWLESKPPLWLDASELLAAIDSYVAHFDGDTLEARVRAWCSHVASQGTPSSIVDAAADAGRWVQACRALLDPQPKMQLRGTRCPECGAEKVWTGRDAAAGESHAKPALGIDATRGVCVCSACRTEWPQERWDLLVQVLELQRQERLQADGYDPRVRAKHDQERWDRRRV